MKKKTKGFTLVEVLAAISVAAILFGLISYSMLFINTTSSEAISESGSSYAIRKIKDYIISQRIDDDKFNYSENTLFYDSSVIFENLPFESMNIDIENHLDDNSTWCTIAYSSNNSSDSINFVVYIGG